MMEAATLRTSKGEHMIVPDGVELVGPLPGCPGAFPTGGGAEGLAATALLYEIFANTILCMIGIQMTKTSYKNTLHPI